MNKGKVLQIMGPVVDVEFPGENSLPKIYNSVEINKNDGSKLILLLLLLHKINKINKILLYI